MGFFLFPNNYRIFNERSRACKILKGKRKISEAILGGGKRNTVAL